MGRIRLSSRQRLVLYARVLLRWSLMSGWGSAALLFAFMLAPIVLGLTETIVPRLPLFLGQVVADVTVLIKDIGRVTKEKS